ncbi:hypothetical protein ACFPU1_11850 [Thalassorhabdus alkalitolerans]|uniref:Uncharacterized protein n=1 Tax=Thalassorhabdus alkalitolerans TaxID=2282697 RepID=A0ABW0YTU5_9BACI
MSSLSLLYYTIKKEFEERLGRPLTEEEKKVIKEMSESQLAGEAEEPDKE